MWNSWHHGDSSNEGRYYRILAHEESCWNFAEKRRNDRALNTCLKNFRQI